MELALTEPINSPSLEIGSVASPHWWRGLRLQPVSGVYWVDPTGAWGYADSKVKSHLLSHRSCPVTHSSSSPVTGKEPATPMACLFSRNQAALVSSVVHYHIMEIMEALRMWGLWLVAFLAGTAPAVPIPYSTKTKKSMSI